MSAGRARWLVLVVKKSVVLMDLTHTGGKEGERRGWAGHRSVPTVDDNIERQRRALSTVYPEWWGMRPNTSQGRGCLERGRWCGYQGIPSPAPVCRPVSGLRRECSYAREGYQRHQRRYGGLSGSPFKYFTPDARQESLCSQIEKFIIEPFKAARIRTFTIIVAHDEYRDKEAVSAILSVLSRTWTKSRRSSSFSLSAKNRRPTPGSHSSHPVSPWKYSNCMIPGVLRWGDIKFFRTQLNYVAKTRGDCRPMGDWPSSCEIDVLYEKVVRLSSALQRSSSLSHPNAAPLPRR